MSHTLHLCTSMLKECRTLETLKKVHSFALKAGLDQNPFVAGQLLLLSAVEIPGTIRYARQLFDEILFPDVFMYNTLIRGFSESNSEHGAGQGFLQDSLFTYTRMLHCLLAPDSFSFAFLLKAAANAKCLSAGSQVHCQAFHHGLVGHLFVCTTLISAYAECGDISSAKRAFDETSNRNIVMWNAMLTSYLRCDDLVSALEVFNKMPCKDMTSWNIMLAGYMKAEEIDSGKRLFEEMPMKDSVSWSTLITGLARCGFLDETFGYYQEAQRQGMGSNEVSLTGALSATAQMGSFELGKTFHGYIAKSGFSQCVSVANALLDTYAKCGDLEMARGVFDQMVEKKSTISWSSMMTALAMYGHAQEAIDLFHEMEESGISPDKVTFVLLLYACSHAGLVEEGCKFFFGMTDEYSIEPTIEHYGCMVDLFSRAGMLNKAYEFITEMPINPNDIIWRTLLGACCIYGDVELAQKVKDRLFKLDPNESSDYVLLSNVYAGAGNWKEVSKVRRSMFTWDIKKTPGWSAIEIGKVVYSFVAGDRESEVSKEAHEKLSEIILALKAEDYIPQLKSVLHDIEEEEKEDSISKHSEKLAVAFGLSRLSEGSVIRIVKNLRVCRDCHTMMKSISKVYKREILLRDRSRFHFFKDGSCSCKDYW